MKTYGSVVNACITEGGVLAKTFSEKNFDIFSYWVIKIRRELWYEGILKTKMLQLESTFEKISRNS